MICVVCDREIPPERRGVETCSRECAALKSTHKQIETAREKHQQSEREKKAFKDFLL